MHIRLINLELRSSQRLEAAATAALSRSLNYGLWSQLSVASARREIILWPFNVNVQTSTSGYLI